MLANAIPRVWPVALWVLDIRDQGGCGPTLVVPDPDFPLCRPWLISR